MTIYLNPSIPDAEKSIDALSLGMVQTRSQFEFCLMAVAEETHAILKALPQ